MSPFCQPPKDGKVDRAAMLRSAARVRSSTALGPPFRKRANTDTVKLLMLGYRQELAREFTLFNCFGSSFTALSSLTAIGGTYGIGLTYGGPVVMTWGWLVVMAFTTSVGLSMAELASAYPTSGALYYWSYKLAPPRLKDLACWLTAWILTLGQAAFSASNFYTFVYLVATAAEVQFGVHVRPVEQFLLLAGTIAVIGLLNCGSARLTAFITTLGTMWHIVALAAFCVAVPLLANEHHSLKYVLTTWEANSDATGIDSPVYTALVGLLMAQWTLTGYDGSAHVAEETLSAETNVPRAILLTIAGVGSTGLALVLALTFVKLDAATLYDTGNETGGRNLVLQILIEVTRAASGGGPAGGVALFSIPIVGTFFCSYQSIANNSRMLYAFARDDGVPLSRLAKRVHPGTQAPVYAVLYMLLLTALLSTPMCFNPYVFPAVTSFAVVGCYLAYSLPVLCKLSTGRRFFLAGPFSLGPRLSTANNVVTLAWVGGVTVLFTLPQYYPVTLLNMNWSGPILGMALAFSLGWYYFPKYGARYWFMGPRANLGQFRDVLPSELRRAEAAAAGAAESVAAAAAEAAAALGHTQLPAKPVASDPPRRAASSGLGYTHGIHGDGGGGGGGGGDGTIGIGVGARATANGAAAAADAAAAGSGTLTPPGGSGSHPPVSPRLRALPGTPSGPSVAASPAGTATGLLPPLATVLSGVAQGLTGGAAGGGGGGAAAAATAVPSGLDSPVTPGRWERRGGVGAGMGLPGFLSTSLVALLSVAGGSVGRPRRTGPKSPPGAHRHTHGGGGAATAAARRHSVLSLYDGPLGSGSHIAALLNGSDLDEYDDLVPGGGSTDGTATAADTCSAARRHARRRSVAGPSTSLGLSGLVLTLGLGRREEHWSFGGTASGAAAGGGGGGGRSTFSGGRNARDWPSAFARDRTSLLGRTTAGHGGGGGGDTGDGFGAGSSTRLSTGLIVRLSTAAEGTAAAAAAGAGRNSDSGFGHNSDSGVARAARARLQRASVSVFRMPAAAATGPRDTPASAPAVAAGGAVLRTALVEGPGSGGEQDGTGGGGSGCGGAVDVGGGGSAQPLLVRGQLSRLSHARAAAASPAPVQARHGRPPRSTGPTGSGMAAGGVDDVTPATAVLTTSSSEVTTQQAGSISVYGKIKANDGDQASFDGGGSGGGGGGVGQPAE